MLDLDNPLIPLIPSVTIGSPITLETLVAPELGTPAGGPPTVAPGIVQNEPVQTFSQRAMLLSGGTTFGAGDELVLPITTTVTEFEAFIVDPAPAGSPAPFKNVVLNYDIRSVVDAAAGSTVTVTIRNTAIPAEAVALGAGLSSQDEILLTAAQVTAITGLFTAACWSTQFRSH